MTYINAFLIAFLSAIAGAMASYIWGIPKKRREDEKNRKRDEALIECRFGLQENALKALLRSEIQRIYNTAEKAGYISTYEKNNLSYIHKAYKQIGGNSYIDRLFDILMKMPTGGEDG